MRKGWQHEAERRRQERLLDVAILVCIVGSVAIVGILAMFPELGGFDAAPRVVSIEFTR